MTTTEQKLDEQLKRSLIRETAKAAILSTGGNPAILQPHVERELDVKDGEVVAKAGGTVDDVVNRLRADPEYAPGFKPVREIRTKADFKDDAEKVAWAGKHGWDAYHNLSDK